MSEEYALFKDGKQVTKSHSLKGGVWGHILLRAIHQPELQTVSYGISEAGDTCVLNLNPGYTIESVRVPGPPLPTSGDME